MPKSDETITASAGAFAEQRDGFVTLLRWLTSSTDQSTLLANFPVLLGRDPEVTTRLETESVSRRHAVIELIAGEYTVRDLESKNGVFVNGERALASPLHPGDVLRLGDSCAVVDRVPADDLAGCEELAPGIFGGALLRKAASRAREASAGTLNVLLQGETGTGKQRFARAVHEWGGRAGAFVAVDSAAYTERTLLGHLQAADQGTLLLDEVLELSAELQAELLHVIEQREVLPLGATQAVPVDVKLVAQTQTPLARALARGVFRADLRGRLEDVVIEIPPLRARRADVIPLFFELARQHGIPNRPELEPELIERLCVHDWPMNVRELENIVRRLAARFPDSHAFRLEQVADWLAPEEREFVPRESVEQPVSRKRIAPYLPAELAALRAALERHHGNLTEAAEELGIARPKAYRMLRSEKFER